MPAAGKFRHLVQVQQRTASKDASGQQLDTWADLFSVWANIEPLTARELAVGQAVNTEASHKVQVRWRAELALPVPTAALRVAYTRPEGTRLYSVHGVMNVSEARQQIDLLVSEGLNQG